jgi:hypothetical protein
LLQLGGSIGFGDKKIGQIPHRLPHAVAHGRFLEPVDQSADGAEPDSVLEGDINEWQIAGEPDLVLSNGTVPTQTTTCTQLVNRIPDVIAAPPGLVTVEKLPRLRYRAFPLHTYLPGVK